MSLSAAISCQYLEVELLATFPALHARSDVSGKSRGKGEYGQNTSFGIPKELIK